jgi:hypothetical protein
MGSHAAQGWYLLLFILGFTLAPAGLFALGWPVALLGFALLAGALGGFLRIKEPAQSGRAGAEPLAKSVGAMTSERRLGGAA